MKQAHAPHINEMAPHIIDENSVLLRKSQAPLMTSPSRYEGAIAQAKKGDKSVPHSASTGYEADLEPSKPMMFNGSTSKAHLLSRGGTATPLLSPEITANLPPVVFDIKREYEK